MWENISSLLLGQNNKLITLNDNTSLITIINNGSHSFEIFFKCTMMVAFEYSSYSVYNKNFRENHYHRANMTMIQKQSSLYSRLYSDFMIFIELCNKCHGYLIDANIK